MTRRIWDLGFGMWENYFGRWENYFGRAGGKIILVGQVRKLFWHVGLVCPAGGTPLAEEFCDSGF